MSARLVCPLCATVVVDGADAITPGACPSCGARYEGGEGDAPGAVAAALHGFGADDLDARAVIDAAFRLTPAQSVDRGVAVTSDARDAYYRWWLFVRAPAGGDHRAVIASLIA